MTQFSVPQFVEIEDKVIGPLTVKQFFIFMSGAFLTFVLYRSIPNLFLFIIALLPVAGLTIALSFGRFNGRPLTSIAGSFVGFLSEPHSFVFHKQGDQITRVRKLEHFVASVPQASPADKLSRLHKLTYILDQDIKEEEKLIRDKYIHLK